MMILEHYDNLYERYADTISHFFYSSTAYTDLKNNKLFIELPDRLVLTLETAFSLVKKEEDEGHYTLAFYEVLLTPMKNSNHSKDWHPFLVMAYLNTLLEYIYNSADYTEANAAFKYIEDTLLQIYDLIIKNSYNYQHESDVTKQLMFGVDNNNSFIHKNGVYEQIRDVKEDAYLSIGELSTFKDSNELKEKIINEINTLYYQVEAIDDEGGNMLDCLARIQYHGPEHFYYEMVMDTLKSDISNKVSGLPIQDIVVLFNNIYEVAEDCIIDIKDWKEFKSLLLNTDELRGVLLDIERSILNTAPEYFPYAVDKELEVN